jgi:hypothetical protein
LVPVAVEVDGLAAVGHERHRGRQHTFPRYRIGEPEHFRVPSLVFLIFLPIGVVGLAYVVAAIRRVHGGPWWATALRAVVLPIVGAGAVTMILT